MTSLLLRLLLCLMLVLNSPSVAIAGVHLTLMDTDRVASAQDVDQEAQEACHGSSATTASGGGPPSDEQPGKTDCVKLCVAICVQQNHAMAPVAVDFTGPLAADYLHAGAFDEPASSTLPPPLRPPIA